MFCCCCFLLYFSGQCVGIRWKYIEFGMRGGRKSSQWTLKYIEAWANAWNWAKKKWREILNLQYLLFIWHCFLFGHQWQWSREEIGRKMNAKRIYRIWKLSLTCLHRCVSVLAWLCMCVWRERSFLYRQIFIQRLAFIGRCRPFRINLEISYTESIVSIFCFFFYSFCIFISYYITYRQH